MTKRGTKLTLSIFLVLLIILPLIDAHVGMRPARIEFDYKAGEEVTINYYVDTTPDTRLMIFADEDFAEYVTFSKSELQGSGSFLATIKLPDSAEKPGPNNLFIYVKQIVDEASGFGTAISIGALVRINVPYPGKYIETELKLESVNKGENIQPELRVINRGKETVTIYPTLEIKYDNKTVSNTILSEETITLESTKEHTFKKTINTKDYTPGSYEAISKVEYGGAEPSEKTLGFRIGQLNIEIINHTKTIIAGKINPYQIGIRSDWKDIIEGVYANVTLTNPENTKTLNFLTSPITLGGFQDYILRSFADATDLSKGQYTTNIAIHYSGKTTTKESNTEIINETPKKIIIIGATFLALIVIITLITYIVMRGKKKSKSQKSE